MNQIDNLSDEAFQITKIVLDDGSVAQLALYYRPAVQRWFFDLTYGNRSMEGLGLVVHPNLLRPWKNLLPFGLACVTTDGADPVAQDDFSGGRATLYSLSAADVATVESSILTAAS